MILFVQFHCMLCAFPTTGHLVNLTNIYILSACGQVIYPGPQEYQIKSPANAPKKVQSDNSYTIFLFEKHLVNYISHRFIKLHSAHSIPVLNQPVSYALTRRIKNESTCYFGLVHLLVKVRIQLKDSDCDFRSFVLWRSSSSLFQHLGRKVISINVNLKVTVRIFIWISSSRRVNHIASSHLITRYSDPRVSLSCLLSNLKRLINLCNTD